MSNFEDCGTRAGHVHVTHGRRMADNVGLQLLLFGCINYPNFLKKVYNVLVTIYRPILIVVGVAFVEKHIVCKFSDFAGQITRVQ